MPVAHHRAAAAGLASGLLFVVACYDAGDSESQGASHSRAEAADGGGAREFTTASACAAVAACGAVTLSECEALFGMFVFSEACLEAIETAPCEAHQPGADDYTAQCLPPCMQGVEPTCEGDNLTGCVELENGVEAYATLRCDVLCERAGLVYTGTCGTELGSRRSDSDVCFCLREDGGVTSMSTGGMASP